MPIGYFCEVQAIRTAIGWQKNQGKKNVGCLCDPAMEKLSAWITLSQHNAKLEESGETFPSSAKPRPIWTPRLHPKKVSEGRKVMTGGGDIVGLYLSVKGLFYCSVPSPGRLNSQPNTMFCHFFHHCKTACDFLLILRQIATMRKRSGYSKALEDDQKIAKLENYQPFIGFGMTITARRLV